MNSLPLPGPSLVALHRSAVHLRQAANERQADPQSSLRALRCPVDLAEHAEDLFS